MTEEVKKLIKSVKITSFLKRKDDESGDLIKTDYVLRSDFDCVVEELTKWNKVEDIQPTGNIEKSVLYKTKRGDISSICFKGCNSIFIHNWLAEKYAIEWRYIY